MDEVDVNLNQDVPRTEAKMRGFPLTSGRTDLLRFKGRAQFSIGRF